LRFFGCCSHWLRCAQAPIDWGQSIYHASSLVEPLPPMALRDAQAAASSGFSTVAPTWLRCAQAPIDWGQSIYHVSSLVEPLPPMALHDAQAAASSGFLAVALTGYGALRRRSIGDNRSTIGLPWLKLKRPESDFASILGNNRLKLDPFTTLTRRPEVRQVIAKLDQAEFSASWLARHRQSSRFLDRWLAFD